MNPPKPSDPVLFKAEHISMEFPGVRALDNVSLEFVRGEVHGIIGENGAGKSTLMKVLSGVQQPTSGTLKLAGETISMHGVREAQRRGIAMIHQELNLVDELNVFENVYLGRESSGFGVLRKRQMAAETEKSLQEVGARFGPFAKVGELSVAGKQLVEIAKAVATGASILIMDEPTAVLSEPEAESLFGLVARLQQKGVTVLYISHRLVEVCRICDRITVLRDGRHVTTMRASQAQPEQLAGLMVGRDVEDFYPAKSPAADQAGPPALEVEGVRGASFSVRRGEILGIAGLVGAGRTELAEAIFGARSKEGGSVRILGHRHRLGSPRKAIGAGLAYVSEDRKATGLHLSLSCIWNVSLANLKHYGKLVMNSRHEARSAEQWKRELDVRVTSLSSQVGSLSGGNQQKISLAKWLDTEPKVLLLDEPTRGVDVGAKREIYGLIHRLAASGMACVLISSELPEIIGVCHRAIVMREGRVMGELTGDELNETAAMRLAAGVVAA